jgi:diguanylate cyclase (GGDEF)-like protein
LVILHFGVRAVTIDTTERYNYRIYETKRQLGLSRFFKVLRLWYLLFSLILLFPAQGYLTQRPMLVYGLMLAAVGHGLIRYYKPVDFNPVGWPAILLSSIDFIFIGALVYLTGGTHSFFQLAYILPILAATVRYGLYHGYFSLGLAVLMTGLSYLTPTSGVAYPPLFYFVFGFGTMAFAIWSIKVLLEEELRLREELYNVSVTDHLTGLYHSGFIRERIRAEINLCNRSGGGFTIVFLDLDQFKKVNDRHGHLIGDEVLKYYSGLMKRVVRNGEMLGRYGGDEFLLLLPGANRMQGEQALQRLCTTVTDNPFLSEEGSPVQLGVSGGVAVYPENGTALEELLQAADMEMYGRKV